MAREETEGRRGGAGASRRSKTFERVDVAAADALRRLEQASDAAERLIAQAAEEAAARIQDRLKPPPSGWQRPDEPAPPPPSADFALLLGALRELVPRELVPDELQQRLAEAVRELLLAIRALLDWYLMRLDQRRTEPTQVQDIPIS